LKCHDLLSCRFGFLLCFLLAAARYGHQETGNEHDKR
jgi:hypothetical protein